MFPSQNHANIWNIPDSKVHGANMGPSWGRQDPGGPHAGPMNFAIWDGNMQNIAYLSPVKHLATHWNIFCWRCKESIHAMQSKLYFLWYIL